MAESCSISWEPHKDINHMFICLSGDGPLGSFHFGAFMNNAAVNTCVQVFVWICVFISHGHILGSEMSAS